MTEFTGIGVLTLDRAFRVQSWNRWLETATGLAETALCGRDVTELTPPARVPLIREACSEVLEHGTTRVLAPALHGCVIDCPPRHPTPEYREMQQRITIAPLRGDAGVVGLIITVEDVTDRLVAERQLVVRSGAADWRIRVEATRVLKETASPEQIAELLTSLERNHHDFSVLSGALGVLVAVNRDVVEPITQLLAAESANLRMHAALALGSVGGDEAVDALIGALDDEDQNVRFHAIEALGRLGAAGAVTPLSRVAASGDFFLAFPAIDALARIEDADVLPVLVSLLDQEELQAAVVDALSALGDEDCVPALAGFINDGRGDVVAICATLERIAERYARTIGDGALIADRARQAINPAGAARIYAGVQSRRQPLRGLVVAAGWCGKPALGALLAVLDVDDVQSEVSSAIARIGRDAVPALVDCMRTGTRNARIAAAQLLGILGDRRATAALIDTVASHDSEIVSAAVGALADLGDPEALDALLGLFSHPDVMVRRGALAAVQSLGHPRLGTYAREALHSSDSRVRESALRIAGYFGFPDCVPGIIGALQDPFEDVRRAAIEQLPLVEDGGSATRLVAALQSDSAKNRAAAAHALRSVDAPGVESALVAALDDVDPWVRYFAAGSLEVHAAGPEAVSALAHLAIADPAPHVRIAAVTALTTLSPASLSDIVPGMVEDVDENVAVAAINALPYLEGAAADAQLDGALRGTNAALRLAAASALAHRATPHGVSSLAWAAQLGDPMELTAVAVEGLKTIARSAAPDTARAAVDALVVIGGDPKHRDLVTETLAALGPAAIGWLRDAYSTAGSAGRVVLIHAWARVRHPDASHLVAEALGDPAPQVRTAAVLALGRIGSPIARDQVVTLAATDPRPSVRRAAASVCRRLSWETLANADDGQ